MSPIRVPIFSVADVFNGYVKSLRKFGHEVETFNLNDRLVFFANAHMEVANEWVKAFDNDDAVRVAARQLHSSLYEFWPDLLIVISAFYISPLTWDLLRWRPHRTAVIFTESPYEDDRQLRLVEDAQPDAVIVNDPQNLDLFREVHGRVQYFPHAHDPDLHHPGNGHRDIDCMFVGTDYPSRRQFLESVNWSGIDVRLAGHWQKAAKASSPLMRYVIHPTDECFPNDDAADLYRRARTSLNLYRGKDDSEANAPELQHGWAIGPREVELAACETWFARESRGEGDGLFPMLPTFTEPAEFEHLLRWALTHPEEREAAAVAAHAAISDRTFDENARRLLNLLDA